MQGSLYNISFENYSAALLAFIPALLNIGIILYIFFYLPKSKLTNLFGLFVFTLFLWQMNDVMMRLSLSEETARRWDGLLSLGWIFLAPVGLHFALVYSDLRKWGETRLLLSLIYFPFILFESFYRVNIEGHHFFHFPFWGWVNQPTAGSLEEMQRFWISGMVALTVYVLMRDAYLSRNNSEKKFRSLLIASGLLIPAMQGTLTQLIYPLLLDAPEIPVTSTGMTFFSIATGIALTRYKLFSVSESVNVDTVLESLTDFVFIVSRRKRIIYMNPYTAKIFGVKPGEADLFYLRNFFGKESGEYERFCDIVLESTFNKTAVKNFVTDFVAKDFSRIKVLLSSEQIINNGIVQGVMLVGRDITKQHASEQQLRTSAAQLLAAQQIAHIGSWEWDVSTNRISWSDEMYRIMGFTPGKLEPNVKFFLERVHPDDLRDVKEKLDEAFDEARPVKLNHRIIRPDGEVRWLEGRAELEFSVEGKPIKVIGTDQDITDHKKEEELEKMAMVASKSYNAVIIANKDGNIEWVNEGFKKLTGYSLEDVIGTTAEVLRKGEMTGLMEHRDYFNKLNRTKKPLMYESKNYSREGKEYWALTSVTPVLNAKGELDKIICIDSDITKLKTIEEELRKEKKLSEELMRIKEDFLARMSHEIRTPMNAILGLTGVLLKTDFNPSQKEYLSAIRSSGESLMVIINDLLHVSKMESGKLTFDETRFKLREIIGNTVNIFRSKKSNSKVKFETSFGDTLPESVTGDVGKFTEILMNLLSNAEKFTEKGKISVHAELKEEDEHSYLIEFSVTDTGIGIPENKLNLIFDAFTQASPEVSTRYGGTGLGLNIVKGLAEMMGGHASVKSKVGEGSQFIFSIRFAKAIFVVVKEEVVPDVSFPENFLHNKRVLVAEDHEVNRMLITKILEDWGCQVICATDGKAALRLLDDLAFDFILMDIKMPVMDGYEATNLIRLHENERVRALPIIALTAHAALWESNKCAEAGMDDYISKPFEPEVLFAKICRLLAKSQTHENIDAVESKSEQGNGTLTNLNYLKQVARGNKDFMRKIISTFLTEFPENVKLLNSSYEKKDWDSLYFIAHKIKPSLTFMGVKELEPLIQQIEMVSKDKNEEVSLTDLLDQIKTTGLKVSEELEEAIKEY